MPSFTFLPTPVSSVAGAITVAMDPISRGDGVGGLYRRRRSAKLFGIRLGPRRQVLYAVLTIGFSIFANLVFLWPVSHFWALVLIWISLSSVMFSDWPRRRASIGSGSALAAGALIYALAGPATRPPSIDRTWLVARDAATPPNLCSSRGVTLPAGGKLVLVGDSAVIVPLKHGTPILSVGGCKSVAMYQTGDGLLVGVDDYDDYGQPIFHITNNQLRLVDGQAVYEARARDHGSVSIHGGDNQELVRLTYINPRTLRLSGLFACKNHPPVHIEDGKPIPGLAGAVCVVGKAVEVP